MRTAVLVFLLYFFPRMAYTLTTTVQGMVIADMQEYKENKGNRFIVLYQPTC